MKHLPKNFHSSWYPYVEKLFEDERMIYIRDQLLWDDESYYPDRSIIFKVFEMPIQDIKVVILGQDPYSKKGQATGRAFAVPYNIPIPPSLKIITNELVYEKLDTGFFNYEIPEWRELEHWVEQGVFLLNTALTVRRGVPNTHTREWRWFTEAILKIISEVADPVFLLWGSNAKSYSNSITVDKKQIFTAPHPAAEAYTPGAGFIGCDHFIKANSVLAQKGQEVINF